MAERTGGRQIRIPFRTIARRLLRFTSSHNRPWQIAAAVSLGIAAGLVPLTSALKLLAFLALVLLPIHLPIAVITALVVGAIAPLTAPWIGALGSYLLEQPTIQVSIARIQSYPLVAWLQLNHTVVHGAIVVAILQLLPTFWLTKLTINRVIKPDPHHTEGLQINLRDPDFMHAPAPAIGAEHPGLDSLSIAPEAFRPEIELPIWNAQAAGSPAASEDAPIAASIAGAAEMVGENSSAEELIEPRPLAEELPVRRVENFLSECNSTMQEELDSSQVAERAAKLAGLVDDMLKAMQAEDANQEQESLVEVEPGILLRTDQPHGFPAESEDSGENGTTVPQRDLNSSVSSSPSDPIGKRATPPLENTQHAESMHNELPVPADDVTGMSRRADSPVAEGTPGAPHQDTATSSAQTQEAHDIAPHEEALRYLLHHLKEIKDEV